MWEHFGGLLGFYRFIARLVLCLTIREHTDAYRLYCGVANAPYTNHSVYCSERVQGHGHTSLKATKTGLTTPVPPALGCIGGLFNALPDLTCKVTILPTPYFATPTTLV